MLVPPVLLTKACLCSGVCARQTVDCRLAEQGNWYLQEPDPHISVAWLLGNHHQALSKHISKGKLASINWTQTVDSIQCCVGQRIFRVWPIET